MKIDHQEMVNVLVKPGIVILGSLTPAKCHLLHMASKLCSEAGELMDAVGKNVYYEKPLETLNANIDKLSLRYPNFQYTNQAAQERADKK